MRIRCECELPISCQSFYGRKISQAVNFLPVLKGDGGGDRGNHLRNPPRFTSPLSLKHQVISILKQSLLPIEVLMSPPCSTCYSPHPTHNQRSQRKTLMNERCVQYSWPGGSRLQGGDCRSYTLNSLNPKPYTPNPKPRRQEMRAVL